MSSVTGDRTVVTEIEGRRLVLSNLGKVLYPEAGFTKSDVISYYLKIAPVLLPHLADRPVTFFRCPDGVDGTGFFEKHLPRGAPSWVSGVEVPRRSGTGGETMVYPVVGDVATLVWAANLAVLELHVPLWRSVGPGEFGLFDQMVFDLDPGPPATAVECARVALLLVDALEREGHADVAVKTSGSKGLQLYVPLDPPRQGADVRTEARAVARSIERNSRDLVVSNMRKDLRGGKVLIDWSQNSPVKTTVAAYSLRAKPWPTVSTPVTMAEVHGCATSGDPDALRFLPDDVLARVEQHGDLFLP